MLRCIEKKTVQHAHKLVYRDLIRSVLSDHLNGLVVHAGSTGIQASRRFRSGWTRKLWRRPVFSTHKDQDRCGKLEVMCVLSVGASFPALHSLGTGNWETQTEAVQQKGSS